MCWPSAYRWTSGGVMSRWEGLGPGPWGTVWKQKGCGGGTHVQLSKFKKPHTDTRWSGGHNFHHGTSVNPRQLTGAHEATSAPRRHKHLVRCSPDVLKHN